MYGLFNVQFQQGSSSWWFAAVSEPLGTRFLGTVNSVDKHRQVLLQWYSQAQGLRTDSATKAYTRVAVTGWKCKAAKNLKWFRPRRGWQGMIECRHCCRCYNPCPCKALVQRTYSPWGPNVLGFEQVWPAFCFQQLELLGSASLQPRYCKGIHRGNDSPTATTYWQFFVRMSVECTHHFESARSESQRLLERHQVKRPRVTMSC